MHHRPDHEIRSMLASLNLNAIWLRMLAPPPWVHHGLARACLEELVEYWTQRRWSIVAVHGGVHMNPERYKDAPERQRETATYYFMKKT